MKALLNNDTLRIHNIPLQASFRVVSIVLLCFSISPLFARQSNLHPTKTDSLQQILQRRSAEAAADSAYFALTYTLAKELRDRAPDSAIIVAQKAVFAATAIKSDYALARANYVAGYAYKNRGMTTIAVEYFLGGLKIAENHQDTSAITLLTSGLGATYMQQKRYDLAENYLRRSMRLSQLSRDITGQLLATTNIGLVLWRLREFDSALAYHAKSLEIAQKMNDSVRMGVSFINFGVCYQGKQDFTQALRYFQKALSIAKSFGNKRMEMLAHFYQGSALHDMKRSSEALPRLKQAVEMADTYKLHEQLQDAFAILSDTYTSLGRLREATEAMRRYAALKDSLYTSENMQQINLLEIVYKNEQKDKEIRLLQQVNESTIFQRTLYAAGALSLLGFSLLLVYFNRQKTRANSEVMRQKNILEEQAREIELANTKLHENNLKLQQLNTEIEQKVTELEAIDTIVQSINSEVRLEKLLPMLLEQGHLLIPTAEKSSILMLDEESGTYRFIAFHGYDPALFSHLRFSPEETRTRYISTQPVQEGVYVLTEYAVEVENGAKFTNIPPECSLVMTISLEQMGGSDLPLGILFFDNYTTKSAFSALDIERFQRFRKHVITAFAKARIVEAEHNTALQLTAQNQRLQDLDREKNEFLGIAAHDMKSPLAGIMASVGLLKRFFNKLSAEDAQKTLTGIEQITKRMSEIITNLLDINAIESGKLNLNPQTIDFTALIRDTLEHYRERAVAKDLSILFYGSEQSFMIFADSGACTQVLDNIVSNAVKYSPAGKRVAVKQEDLGKCIRVSVTDEGAGIPPEDMQRMFGKFARLSTKPTAGEDSTGLGLSIVKRLTEAMDGKIWCESELGKGTTFFVEFPKASESA